MIREAAPTTNISIFPVEAGGRVVEAAAAPPQARVGLPPWMLSHLSG